MFEWGIALHGLYSEQDRAGTAAEKSAHTRALRRKITRQISKDFLLFPALAGRRWRRVLFGNVVANLLRNLWAYAVICCGHFADGAEKFTPEALEDETTAQWYLRQMLGSANFRAGPVMAFMSGNLCYQIEHHLFPDLPSNRYAQIAERVQAVCAKYELPYTTGPLARQYLLVLRTIVKLALPDRFLAASSDDAPETASEEKFRGVANPPDRAGVGNPGARRHNRLHRGQTSPRRRVVASAR
jgi:fatty acid desaturase